MIRNSALPLVPKQCNFCSKMLWVTESKALAKSKNIALRPFNLKSLDPQKLTSMKFPGGVERDFVHVAVNYQRGTLYE